MRQKSIVIGTRVDTKGQDAWLLLGYPLSATQSYSSEIMKCLAEKDAAESRMEQKGSKAAKRE